MSMKICLFIYSLGVGGAERVSTHLANSWALLGHEVTIITLAPISSDAYVLHPAVHRVALGLAEDSSHILSAFLANFRRITVLRRALKRLAPDVLLGMMTTSAVLAVIAASGLRCRVIISERSYPPLLPVGRLWSVLRMLVYRRASAAVALTSEGRDWLQRHAGCRRIIVIPNPVVWPLPASALPVQAPTQLLTSGRRLLLAVGRMDAGKGFDILIKAFSRVADAMPGWDLVILGDGPQREVLERERTQQGLDGRVFMPGRAGNMQEWYSRADLFVLSSRYEGFPNTLVEAMASGCAAVSFDCDTGPRDIIQHGSDGLLVHPVGDALALADALALLMADEKRRQAMSELARRKREEFSLHRILALWEDVLHAASNGK